MRVRASSLAALAALLLGGLSGCVAAPAPSCPAAALLAAPPNPPAPANAGTPQQAPLSSFTPSPPVSAAPRAPAFPASIEPAAPPRSPEPSDIEPDYAAPGHAAAQQFSGSSSTPSAGRAPSRRGDHHRPPTRHRDWDLDDGQIEAQWINPPVGAGE
ncbi:MAG TPA: hypothetical protein VF007_05850 [Stellaceae bacterium]